MAPLVSDTECREMRRLAGLPYITRLVPAGRIVSQGNFTLTVTGANFTPQTVISWGATKLPTQFINTTNTYCERHETSPRPGNATILCASLELTTSILKASCRQATSMPTWQRVRRA